MPRFALFSFWHRYIIFDNFFTPAATVFARQAYYNIKGNMKGVVKLTVYADILIITNLIIDYFLLAITAGVIGRSPPLIRQLSASLLASFSTLIIFLPQQHKLVEIGFRIVLSYIICLVCFGFGNLRRSLLAGAVFFIVTFAYAGGMMAIWYIFTPHGMAINNSVVYFNISPLFLVFFSVLAFLLFSLFSFLFARRHKTAKDCYVTVTFCGKKADFKGIIDSGNSLSDVFSQSPVIVADYSAFHRTFESLSAEKYPHRYRAVPCSTVSGTRLLDGFRFDSGKIITENKAINLTNPIIAISKTPLLDCEAIVNPDDCE